MAKKPQVTELKNFLNCLTFYLTDVEEVKKDKFWKL